ncbi:TetR family transcriptional regulator [Silvimonas sp. JCM 19000]
MTARKNTALSSRKQPQQARSTELVATILTAAIQVLAREGATRFTTARVAEKAGVSVGSVYQYFPNKAAILFRLQQDEWEQTTAMLRAILQNPAEAPLQRVRTLVHAFLKSECDEAEMRVALSDSAPLYRDAPETEAVRAAGDDIVARYMQELLPQADAAHRALAGDLINSTLSAVGKEFSSRPRSAAEIVSYADAMADMFIAYLQQLGAAAPAASGV